MTALSVVVITLNEEKHLRNCLQSLPRGSEVCVLDSGSTDRTVEIARELGARVEHRPFTTYSEQKNAAVAMATGRWVLSIDADEVIEPALRLELERITGSASSGGPVGYRLKRQLVFMGRRMRFGKTTDWPLRLFERGKGRFEQDIHEHVEVIGGTVGCTRGAGAISHYSYDDLSDYFERFNAYTTRIARNHLKNGKKMPPGLLHVLRPWSEFVVRYFLRLGFLDGYPGYCYALLSSVYTYVKYAKLRELTHATYSSEGRQG
jgi:glycosyltransferase involved in cell wall biosynthesis